MGGGGGLGGFGGSYDFQGEPREDQSPLKEYKWGTVEDWLPMKGIIRILQSLWGGGGGWGNQVRVILAQPIFSVFPGDKQRLIPKLEKKPLVNS